MSARKKRNIMNIINKKNVFREESRIQKFYLKSMRNLIWSGRFFFFFDPIPDKLIFVDPTQNWYTCTQNRTEMKKKIPYFNGIIPLILIVSCWKISIYTHSYWNMLFHFKQHPDFFFFFFYGFFKIGLI